MFKGVKTLRLALLSFLGLFLSCSVFAEDITITTYYPSPYGVYEELRSMRVSIGPRFYKPSNIDMVNNYPNTDLLIEGGISRGADVFDPTNIDISYGEAVNGSTIMTGSTYSSILNGDKSGVLTYSNYSNIIGMNNQSTITYSDNSSIIGGNANTLSSQDNSIISAGESNRISYVSENNAITAGSSNLIENSDNSVIVGGYAGLIHWGTYSLIGAGHQNEVDADYSGILAGYSNLINGSTGNPQRSVILGGYYNEVETNDSVAMGRYANVQHDNSFMWAGSGVSEYSKMNNSFHVAADLAYFKAAVGLGEWQMGASYRLHVNGNSFFDGNLGVGLSSTSSAPSYPIHNAGDSYLIGNVGVGDLSVNSSYKLNVNGTSRVLGNAIFADKVGINNSNPSTNLHIGDGTSSSSNPVALMHGNGAALRIIAYGSGGNNWIQSASSTSSGSTADLNISGFNGSPIHMTVKANGRVGIGTTNPSYTLHVNGSAKIDNTLWVYTTSYSSDRRYKKNISSVNDALKRISGINGTTFDWRADEFPDRNFPSGKQYGVIAQEVEAIFPDLVNDGEDGYKGVNYTGLIPVLIEAMKEQQKMIEALEERINVLENK